MIKVILFALLVVGCTCTEFQPFNRESDQEFRDHSPNNEIPVFAVVENHWMPKFKVTRPAPGNALVFHNEDYKREKGNFRLKKENIGILSLMFEFSGNNCRFYVTFKSTCSEKEWTVNSKVFAPPEEEGLWEDVVENAVYAEEVTSVVANQLIRQGRRRESVYNRLVAMSVPWILKLIQNRRKPRFDHSPQDNPAQKHYSGVPLVFEDEVLVALNKARGDLNIMDTTVIPVGGQ